MKQWQGLLIALAIGLIAGGPGWYQCGKRSVGSSLVSRLTNPWTAVGLVRSAFATPKRPARTVLIKVPRWYERTVKVPEVRWQIQPLTDTIYVPDWKLTRVDVCGSRVTGIAVKGDSALAFESGCGWRNRFSIHVQDDGARASVSWLPFDLGVFVDVSMDVPVSAFAENGGFTENNVAVSPSISTGLAVKYRTVQLRVGPGWSWRDGFTASAGLDWRWWF